MNSELMICRKKYGYKSELVLLSLCLLACQSTTFPVATQPLLDLGVSNAEICGEPAQCFGLYVDMEDHDFGMPGYGGQVTRAYADQQVKQRLYQFEAGRPITITATLLVFGPDTLNYPISSPRLDYQISIVDDANGNEVARTVEFQVPGRHPGIRTGPLVTQYSPYMERFAIDSWFDLAENHQYTLHLTRTVYISDTEVYVGGNPVIFHIYAPLD